MTVIKAATPTASRNLLRRTLLAVCAVTSLTLGACGKKDEGPPAAPASTSTTTTTTTTTSNPPAGDPAADARKTFDTVCAACHGADGKGDGPGAASLDPKPRNYTDKDWQAKTTDDQIKQTILMGGAAVGKSAAMPAQPQFRDKPELMNELVKIIRAFGK